MTDDDEITVDETITVDNDPMSSDEGIEMDESAYPTFEGTLQLQFDRSDIINMQLVGQVRGIKDCLLNAYKKYAVMTKKAGQAKGNVQVQTEYGTVLSLQFGATGDKMAMEAKKTAKKLRKMLSCEVAFPEDVLEAMLAPKEVKG